MNGTVKKRTTAAGDPRWDVRWRDPDGTAHRKTFTTASAAKAYLSDLTNGQRLGTYVDPRAGRLLTREWATTWVVGREASWRPSTRSRVASEISNHILPALGAVPVNQLRPSIIRQAVADWQRTLAPGTVANLLGTLKLMLDDAVEDLLLGVNPAAGVSAPGRPRRKVTDLTPEQVGLLLEHAGEDRALLLVLAGLGLRRSEASGLQAGDVDFLHRTVHVRRQRHPGGRVDAPKSSAGLREIPAVPDVLTALAAHMEALGLHVDDRDATCSTTRRRSPVGSRGSPAARRSPPPPTPYATTSAPASSAAG